MGEVRLNKLQQVIFNEFSKNKSLHERFYFTGGSALSVFYLGHRVSEDMDFFSEEDFDNELVFAFVKDVAQKLGLEERFTQKEKTRIFELVRKNKNIIKIDFAHYPFKRLREGKEIQGVKVDSLLDIAVNKVLLVNQRTDVKDFVDLYFLKDEFTVWDLMAGVRKKFGFELDPILVAADFLKVEEFDFLPKMLVPLKIADLQAYFKKKAKEISGKFV